jgi:hypothetical protein
MLPHRQWTSKLLESFWSIKGSGAAKNLPNLLMVMPPDIEIFDELID